MDSDRTSATSSCFQKRLVLEGFFSMPPLLPPPWRLLQPWQCFTRVYKEAKTLQAKRKNYIMYIHIKMAVMHQAREKQYSCWNHHHNLQATRRFRKSIKIMNSHLGFVGCWCFGNPVCSWQAKTTGMQLAPSMPWWTGRSHVYASQKKTYCSLHLQLASWVCEQHKLYM